MLQKTIPSYAYTGFQSDSDIQAFIRAYNDFTQQIITWFDTINLPVYTSDTISGDLMDWVGQGVYGYQRPVLSNGDFISIGTLDSFLLNSLVIGGGYNINSAPYYVTSDDIYKRCLTWRFYKGDGFYFTIPWLKRRIMRFLNGANGTAPNIDQTYQVSVTVNETDVVSIRFLSGDILTFTSGSLGTSMLNELPLNGQTFTVQTYPNNPYIQYLIDAFNSGVLDLPFQYDFQFFA